MKLFIQFKKEFNARNGRSVSCKLGKEAPVFTPKPHYSGKGFAVNGRWCETIDQAQEWADKLAQEWAAEVELVTLEIGLAEGVESSGSTYAFDAWENRFSTIDLSGLDAAIETVCGHYSAKLYRDAFFRVFEHGHFSINEMIEMGWIIKDPNPIINLTQHAATAEQVEAGVVEPADKGAVQTALTFDAIPTAPEMVERADLLARVAVDSGCKRAMIGGAPFFMAPLERALLDAGITPVYAFSVRDSVEQPDGNGGVRKVNVFRHIGFVEAAQ